MPNNHPIAQEELMAYLDGELSPDRAATAADHLGHCRECQDVAADLQGVSRRLMAWEVEASNARITETIAAALSEPRQKSTSQISRGSKWVIGLVAACVVALVLTSVTPRMMPQRNRFGVPQPTAKRINESMALLEQSATVDAVRTQNPMIAHTAQLTLTTQEFEKARGAVEDILKRHKGYIGHLNVYARAGAGRSSDATLRVPADQLDPTLAEIKRLGHVEMESQSGEEVTAQYIDLDARLTNARNTEQRLTDLLRQRTGKLADVLSVELELGRVRGEIERMQAEKKTLTNRVDFATLNATVREDYQAIVPVGPFSVFARFRNAAVDGYRSTVESMIAAIAFLLAFGPVLLVWIAILFFPARFVWRRVRRNPTH
jgi:Domain of unknown function (DUF4349)/Putative zinc-finger